MTQLTAIMIIEDENVVASSYGPVDGKFGLYIGTVAFSPSGCERPRPLLTSDPIYATAEEARTAAETIVAKTKASNPAESCPAESGRFQPQDGK
jgi:hypothetical protein